MMRESVESSDIASIGYNESTLVLEIEFQRSGGVYQYFGVPKNIYQSLLLAKSHGQFFHEKIKDHFSGTKVL